MRNKRFPNYPDDVDYTTNSPSYYDDMARKQKLIQLLAEKIWEYDERLDERFEDLENVLQDYLSQWDTRIENLDDEVSHIFVTWLNDGTLEQIINHDVLGNKADKVYVDELNENISTHLEQIGINPVDFGAVFNGEHDDAQAINNAITYADSLGGGLVLLSGKVGIGSTINLVRGVSLLSQNAFIIPLADINVISFDNETSLLGTVTFDSEDISRNFTNALLYFDGSKHLSERNIFIEDVRMFGSYAYGRGTAIHFDCSMDDSSISFVTFGNVHMRGFDKGIFFDAPKIDNAVGHNYINGNTFNNLSISNCDYYIYATGGHDLPLATNHVDGNIFADVQLQHGKRAVEMIYLEGWQNIIKGFVWDAGGKDSLVTNLRPTSKRNMIELYGSTGKDIYVDLGEQNYVYDLDKTDDYLPRKTANPKARDIYRYNGDFENILSRADKINEVSILAGSDYIINNTALENIFDSTRPLQLMVDLAGDKIFTFKIDFDARNYPNGTATYIRDIKKLGFVFESYRLPKKISVTVVSNTGIRKTTTHNFDPDDARGVFTMERSSANGFQDNIKTIEVTLEGQLQSDVRLGSMFASSFYVQGLTYLSQSGGKLLGELDMNDNFFKIGRVSNISQLPTANSVQKGKMIIVDGYGTNPDKIMVCLYQSDQSHHWVELPTA